MSIINIYSDRGKRITDIYTYNIMIKEMDSESTELYTLILSSQESLRSFEISDYSIYLHYLFPSQYRGALATGVGDLELHNRAQV